MFEEDGAEQTTKERLQAFMVKYNALGWYIAAIATANLVYTVLAH